MYRNLSGRDHRLFVLAPALLAVALAGCMEFDLAEGIDDDVEVGMSQADLSNNTHYDGFQMTNYIVAVESQLSGQKTGDSSYVCPPGLGGACYHKEFLCSGWGVAMQGTGLANDGKYVKFAGGGGPWSSGYTWWQNCSSTSFTYSSGVIGASGRTLVNDYSIAVDPNYIPLGWYVWIDSLNRWHRADDTGGAITGYHIDVYTGPNNPSYNFTSGIYLTSTYHNATDPSPYGGGGTTTIIVDDSSSGFTKYGPSSYWWEAWIGYSGHMWYTYVNGSVKSNYVRWKPNAPSSGSYAVYAYVPSNHATSQQAKYRIYHQGVNSYSTINQNIYYDQWVYLGTWGFNAGSTDYVELSDATGESYTTYRKIGFDAIKFVKQ